MIFLFTSLWKTLLKVLSNVLDNNKFNVNSLKKVHKMPDKISLSQKKIESQCLWENNYSLLKIF